MTKRRASRRDVADWSTNWKVPAERSSFGEAEDGEDAVNVSLSVTFVSHYSQESRGLGDELFSIIAAAFSEYSESRKLSAVAEEAFTRPSALRFLPALTMPVG